MDKRRRNLDAFLPSNGKTAVNIEVPEGEITLATKARESPEDAEFRRRKEAITRGAILVVALTCLIGCVGIVLKYASVPALLSLAQTLIIIIVSAFAGFLAGQKH